MKRVLAEALDANVLPKTIAAAIIAGVGVLLLFSFTVLGAARSTEASRAGRPVATVVYGALATVGLIMMSQK